MPASSSDRSTSTICGDDVDRGAPVGARMIGRDAVDGRRRLGDLDAGVGDPVAGEDHRAARIEQPDVRGDDPIAGDVDSGRLQVEHADDARPRRRTDHLLQWLALLPVYVRGLRPRLPRRLQRYGSWLKL